MNTVANGALAQSAAKILVVEDDPALREALVDTLQLADYDVREADSAESALELLKTQADIAMVVSDVNMGKLSGHDLLRIIKSSYAHIPVLLITAYASISESVEAMREGAVDYLVKPFEPNLLTDAVKKFVGAGSIHDDEPIVADPSSRQLLQLASRVAQAESTVLLLGESGTGKEVLARYIHNRSPRASSPSSPLIAPLSPKTCLRPFSLVTKKGLTLGRTAPHRVSLSRPMVELCCSTKYPRWTLVYRQNCCACCKSAKWSGSAGARTSRWMCG